ncbi:hypothetical protein CL630_01260 [bacterium]|nr:hypothetical protein [bacterium]|tara:strand:+ start:3424 stop:3966 length:543 start_codon:yes stop_codon:yes gene_type:complete
MRINESLFLFLNNLAGKFPIFDTLVIFSAEYLLFWLIAGATVFLLLKKENSLKRILILFISISVAWGISQIINTLYPSPRPFLILDGINLLFEHGGYDSFPSGNTTIAFALAAGLFYYNKPVAWLFVLGALLVGISRIIAGVHWPFDILGGLILGGIVSAAIYSLYQKFHQKPTPQEPQE